MEETIELKELFIILKKRLWLMILLGVIGLSAAGAYSHYMIVPMYSTSTDLIVNNTAEGALINQGDINTSINLINTYSHIIRTRRILDEVAENLNLQISAGALRNMVWVGNPGNTQILTIGASSTDPLLAQQIANETASVFQNNIGDILNVQSVTILTPAPLNTSPTNSNGQINMAIGLVVGVMLAVGIAFVLEYLDTKVKTEADIEKVIGTPILGSIPIATLKDFKTKKRER